MDKILLNGLWNGTRAYWFMEWYHRMLIDSPSFTPNELFNDKNRTYARLFHAVSYDKGKCEF